jgi:hypothetical protein
LSISLSQDEKNVNQEKFEQVPVYNMKALFLADLKLVPSDYEKGIAVNKYFLETNSYVFEEIFKGDLESKSIELPYDCKTISMDKLERSQRRCSFTA